MTNQNAKRTRRSVQEIEERLEAAIEGELKDLARLNLERDTQGAHIMGLRAALEIVRAKPGETEE